MFDPQSLKRAREMTRWRAAARAISAVAVSIPIACGSPPSANYARPPVQVDAVEARLARDDAQHVFETRCVVCHGCYDAPCQLKLGTFEGIERGATEAKVYDSTRLLEASPTRLEIDAHDTRGWREKSFHPVLPEGARTDPRASLLLRMLELKRMHPLQEGVDIAKEFSLDLDRKETCTDAEHFDDYAKEHPLWGMPYAMPGLEPSEEAALVRWVTAGAPHPEPPKLAPELAASIEDWEAFLNDSSLKGRLASRYIYEHLFLASLYFAGTDDDTFFRLVRSRTASGAVDEIATRRPFDDPETDRVFYRFVRRLERPLEKTHMPYPLGAARLHRYRELFIEPPYVVDRLPSYEPEVGANPFRAFQAIPAESRYRFMLEEAEFTLMGFIKGPVCRGQVALNVIEDRFWITFLNPDLPWMKDETAFLADAKQDLDMPAEGGSSPFPTLWFAYGREHERYLKKKAEFLKQAVTADGERGVTLDMVWDGDGKNPNAALTVFRHFDSATVVKGLVGERPKTAWVIGYPLLERIYYLLVAGFDVFGNVTHQVATRLYMDFLRMEGEANFLMFLPPARRHELIDHWYRGVNGDAKAQVVRDLTVFEDAPNLRYQAHEAERELFALLKTRVRAVDADGFDLKRVEDASIRGALARLAHTKGRAASWLPELSFVTVQPAGTSARRANINFTIARDSGHTNVAHLFNEEDRRIKDEDALAVVPGFLGAYPNALFEVPQKDLESFVDAIARLDSEGAYRALRARFGVLRTSDGFWRFSDRIQEAHAKQLPVSSGLFDYNRLDAY
jgi:Fatty acid cis/trans isomerase (CTI)